MNCLYREKVYICGEYLEAHIYPVFAVNKKTRRSRYKPSSETQALLNQKNAELYYTRLANANFTSDDIKLELTYNEEHLPANEETRQKSRSFRCKIFCQSRKRAISSSHHDNRWSFL